MKIGYARVSTQKQNIDSQIKLLEKEGCEKIFQEKKSGSSTDERYELKKCLDFCRAGDELIFFKLDRIARSQLDFLNIAKLLSDKGVTMRSTDGQINTKGDESMQKLLISLLSAVAELELSLRKDRQREGIELAKLEGKYKGKQLKNNGDKEEIKKQIFELYDNGMSKKAIALKLGVSRFFVRSAIDNKMKEEGGE